MRVSKWVRAKSGIVRDGYHAYSRGVYAFLESNGGRAHVIGTIGEGMVSEMAMLAAGSSCSVRFPGLTRLAQGQMQVLPRKARQATPLFRSQFWMVLSGFPWRPPFAEVLWRIGCFHGSSSTRWHSVLSVGCLLCRSLSPYASFRRTSSGGRSPWCRSAFGGAFSLRQNHKRCVSRVLQPCYQGL